MTLNGRGLSMHTPGKHKTSTESGLSPSTLPNLGPKSQSMLANAGITSLDQLRKLGAVAAYAQVKAKVPAASLNLLWALEGALCGLPWQVVAREHRTSLLLSLDQLQAGGPNIREAD